MDKEVIDVLQKHYGTIFIDKKAIEKIDTLIMDIIHKCLLGED